MKFKIILGFILMLCSFILGMVQSSVLTNAPNILIDDLQGRQFNLNKFDFKGDILVVFSATYCKPCREEIPALQAIWEKADKDRLIILLVFSDSDAGLVEAFVKKYKIILPVLHDKFGAASKRYLVKGLPSSFLIGPDRKIKKCISGYDKKFVDWLQREYAR